MIVSDIFSLNKDFKDFRLLAGKAGLNREILNVDIMEVPDGVYWVNKGDFIVTTGYCLKNNDTTLENIIQMLATKEAAGLGIKIGRYIDEIPEKILIMAEELNLPIIEVPIAASYNSIVRPILNKIIGDENYDFYTLKEFKQELNRLTKHNLNISAIINLISRYVRNDIYLFWENNLNLVSDDNNLKTLGAKKTISQYTTELMSSGENMTIDNSSRTYEIYKVYGMNIVIAFLCVDLKKGASLTNTDKEIIKEVMPFITVYLLSNTKKAVLYHKSLEEFFFSIIEGNYNEDELKLKEESSYRNIDFSKSRYVWTIESTITDENEYLRLEKKLVSIFQMYDNIFCHKRYSKNIMFIIENQKLQSNTKLLDSFYEKLVLDLKKSFRDQEFTIGISKICNSLKYLYFAGEEANFALKIGKKLNKNPGGVYLYDDYMIYHLLYEISGHPTLSKLYKNTIKRIKKHDSENNSELLKTLETLIDCDFSVSHTSDRLFIHRNTLYKRINKINDILDSDIDKSENRLILQIAMKLNEIISE